MKSYRKIIIVGSPGSGKSYFAKVLSKLTRIPVYHLDMINWKPNWQPTPREELRKTLNEIMDNDEWIIDGNYSGTMEDRFKRAEVVCFLDLPAEVCLESERKRRGKKRDDLPNYLEEKDDPDFEEYIMNFQDTGKIRILSMIEKHPNIPVITFKTRDEVNAYLNNIDL